MYSGNTEINKQYIIHTDSLPLNRSLMMKVTVLKKCSLFSYHIAAYHLFTNKSYLSDIKVHNDTPNLILRYVMYIINDVIHMQKKVQSRQTDSIG